MAIQAFLKKQVIFSNTRPKFNLKEPKKEQQIKPKPSRREIIKIKAEINEIETKRAVEQINKTTSWFFERINKINKPLARLIKEKRERPK